MTDAGFAAVPRAVLKAQGGLSGYAKLTYALIIAHLDQGNDSWPSQKLLAAESGWSEPTVRKAIAELEAAGLVVKERARFENHYHLTDESSLRLSQQSAPTDESSLPSTNETTLRPSPEIERRTKAPFGTDETSFTHGRKDVSSPELEPRTRANELPKTGVPGGTRSAAARPPRPPKRKPQGKPPGESLAPLYDALKLLGVSHPRFEGWPETGGYQTLRAQGLEPGEIARAYQHFQQHGTDFERGKLSLNFLSKDNLAWNWIYGPPAAVNGHGKGRNGQMGRQSEANWTRAGITRQLKDKPELLARTLAEWGDEDF